MQLTQDDKLLAAAIRRLSLERGWTMSETARHFERDVSAVSRWTGEIRRPPGVIRIAIAFGTTAEEVLKPCGNCNYQPPSGYMCLTCGMKGERNGQPS